MGNKEAQFTVGGATPGLVILGAIRKPLSHQEQASKWHSSVASAATPASDSFPDFLG